MALSSFINHLFSSSHRPEPCRFPWRQGWLAEAQFAVVLLMVSRLWPEPVEPLLLFCFGERVHEWNLRKAAETSERSLWKRGLVFQCLNNFPSIPVISFGCAEKKHSRQFNQPLEFYEWTGRGQQQSFVSNVLLWLVCVELGSSVRPPPPNSYWIPTLILKY